MKKLISLLVVVALAATFLVPGTVGAWNLSAGDTGLVATTPLGVMMAQGMMLAMSLLPKWVSSSACNVSVEKYDPTNPTDPWGSQDVLAINVTGLSSEGQSFIAGLADVITWGVTILADLVRIMGGAPSKP